MTTTAQPEWIVIRSQSRRGTPVAEDWIAPFQDAYAAALNAWIASVASGEPFEGASAWDGYAVMTVSAASSASLLGNRPLPVELLERPKLYRAEGMSVE